VGFVQSKAESDIWMQESNGLYEYIAVYVDDLLIASRDPGEITRMLDNTQKFKLKGVVQLTYHLGCDYFCDKTALYAIVLASTSQRYWISLRICLDANQRSILLH
jgi:hypothetical protein